MKLIPCVNPVLECRMKHISKYMNMTKITENRNLKIVGAFLIGVIVGGLFVWMWIATQKELLNKENKTIGNVSEQNTTTKKPISEDKTPIKNLETSETQLRNDAIVVQNQKAGSSVVVDKAVFEEDGWIVIHEGTASHIGNALGAARFDKGEYNNIVVELLRATKEGMVYRAVLYRDNGDKKFNLDTDFPFLQDGNQPVLTTFTVK